MIRLHRPVLAAACGLAALLSGLRAASAQDYTWVETRFHRVHLRNGNFIDGNVLNVTDHTVVLRLRDGDMSIRSNTIDRIELMKMRSLLEKPKLDPPLKKVPAARPTAERAAVRRGDRIAPQVSEELKSNVEALLGRLRVAAPGQKEALIDELSKQPAVSPYLASLLPTLDEEPCYLVRSALMRAKDRSAAPYLVEALDSDRLYVKIHALTLLSIVGSEAVVPDVRAFLSDPNPAVKATAIEALQQLGDTASVNLIADLVGESDDMVRVAAINAAIDLAKKSDRGDVVADSVRRSLAGQSGRLARELLGAAARLGRPELWEPVSRYLQNPDPVLRRAAAEALCVLAVQDSGEVIVDRLRQEEDTRTTVTLQKATAVLKSKSAVPVLIDLLQSRDEAVTRGASSALGAITREAFGDSHERWSAWWERAGRQ